MAFIRWKMSRQGMRRAYLVHSYRDEQGKPRHKTLAYLGSEGALTPDLIAQLQEKHKDLAIAWDKVRPAAKSELTLKPDSMSDDELLHNLKTLRLEKGLSIKAMVQSFADLGFPSWDTGYGKMSMDAYRYKHLEKAAGKGEGRNCFGAKAPDVVPYLRKIFAS